MNNYLRTVNDIKSMINVVEKRYDKLAKLILKRAYKPSPDVFKVPVDFKYTATGEKEVLYDANEYHFTIDSLCDLDYAYEILTNTTEISGYDIDREYTYGIDMIRDYVDGVYGYRQ